MTLFVLAVVAVLADVGGVARNVCAVGVATFLRIPWYLFALIRISWYFRIFICIAQ